MGSRGVLQIDHLFRHAHLLPAVAEMIYVEFWQGSNRMTVDDLIRHLRGARDASRIPLCLVALMDGELAGTVNLIDNDDHTRPHLHPWLAAMVVAPHLRGRGIGTRLVESLLQDARRIGCDTLFLGTDGPGFYARLGAQVHEQVTPEFCIMQFSLHA